METLLILLFLLIVGHCLCDYPLQGDFIGKFKNPSNPNPFPSGSHPWLVLMSAHCFIHAGAVYLITGIIWFALAELLLHFIIDVCKNNNKISFNMDQWLHIFCKACYVVVIGFVS